jgi:hypothetical protein
MSYSYIKSVFPNFEPSTLTNNDFDAVPKQANTVAEANGQDDYYKFAKTLIDEAKSIESFTDVDCDKYSSHVLKCNRCRSMALKHFELEHDKYKNEEIMEILSYIIFGIFILLLIEYLRKN